MAFLDGVTLLDLTHQLAGPFATMLLADMGADVIKVEPPAGDPARRIEPAVAGMSLYFASVNRNKRSVVLDLKSAAGREDFYRLAEQATVVVHNFRPGVMERLGLGEAELHHRNPGLIYCAITGYGENGPDAALPAYDLTIQAASGILGLTGEPGGSPVKPGISLADETAGLFAALAILAATIRQRQTGRGDTLDISLLDCSVAMLSYLGAYHLTLGLVPEPLGTGHPSVAPWGCYPASDGYLAIAVWGDHFWTALCQLLGLEALTTDPKYATNSTRVAHREELDAILGQVFRQRDVATWVSQLRQAGVPVAPVNRLDQTFRDPQVVARGLVLALGDSDDRDLRTVGNPIKSRDGLRVHHRAAPRLGEHSAALGVGPGPA